jgi:hypothetical protein
MKALIYTLKIWLSALFLGSLISEIIYNYSNPVSNLIKWMEFALPLGFVFSLPSFTVLFLLTFWLVNKRSTNKNKKIVISAVSVILCILPFIFFSMWYIPLFDFGLIAPYIAIILIGIWIYKLPPAISIEES